jgi:hypothetical protein
MHDKLRSIIPDHRASGEKDQALPEAARSAKTMRIV